MPGVHEGSQDHNGWPVVPAQGWEAEHIEVRRVGDDPIPGVDQYVEQLTGAYRPLEPCDTEAPEYDDDDDT